LIYVSWPLYLIIGGEAGGCFQETTPYVTAQRRQKKSGYKLAEDKPVSYLSPVGSLQRSLFRKYTSKKVATVRLIDGLDRKVKPMCMAIYATFLVLLWVYSDYMLDQYALSVTSGAGEWVVIALGWEMLPVLWPALLLMVVASSAITFFVMRRLGGK
jgi:hypothetical protein